MLSVIKLLLDKMERFSPKIEIINHFDNLINRIDIDIDSSLEKYNDKQLLGEIIENYNKRWLSWNFFNRFNVKFFQKNHTSKQKLNSWTESTKVVDYLKQIRMKTIEELKNAQNETLEYYKLNSDRFKSELIKVKSIEEMKSELFAEKFYFQVNCKQPCYKLLPFNVFTFVTDFYMSQSDMSLYVYFLITSLIIY